jgi:hypothetical protein
LYTSKREENKKEENDSESGQEMREVLKLDKPANKSEETGRKTFFPLKSSLTALWLPAVVGDHPSLFMATVVSTMVTKILLLVLALALAFSGYQQNLFPHPTILWCEEEWSSKTLTKSLRGDITLCSFDSTSTGLAPCFELSPIESGVQKVRVCSSEEEELVLKISLLFVVVFLNCLSLGAALWLNKIVDYVELFKATKKLLWFIPIKHKEEADLQNELLFLRAAHPDFLDSTFNGTQLKAGSQSSTGAVKAAEGDIAPQTFSKSLT